MAFLLYGQDEQRWPLSLSVRVALARGSELHFFISRRTGGGPGWLGWAGLWEAAPAQPPGRRASSASHQQHPNARMIYCGFTKRAGRMWSSPADRFCRPRACACDALQVVPCPESPGKLGNQLLTRRRCNCSCMSQPAVQSSEYTSTNFFTQGCAGCPCLPARRQPSLTAAHVRAMHCMSWRWR